jgi:histidinol-phosphate aminotransferase
MPGGRAGELHVALRERGVLVKSLHGAHPLLADCLRVTVGTPEENAAFVAALAAAL